MSDLKFIGVNLPSVRVQKQADPDTDSLLLSNYRPSGGGTPMLVEPVANSLSATHQLFVLLDGPGGSDVLNISRNALGTAFTTTITDDASITGNLSVLGSATFGDQASDLVTVAKGWSDNVTDYSYTQALVLDPNDTPTYGSDGSASIYLGTGAAPPTVTGFTANQGSLLLGLDGTVWTKTGAGATAWTQLAAAGASSLQAAYDQGPVVDTAANGTNSAVQISYGGGAGNTHNLLEVNRSPSASSTGRGIEITMGANGLAEGLVVLHSGLGAGIGVSNSGGGAGILVTQSSSDSAALVIDKNVGSTPAIDIDVDAASAASGVRVVLNDGGGVAFEATLDPNDSDIGVTISDGFASVSFDEDTLRYTGPSAGAGTYAIFAEDQASFDLSGHRISLRSGSGGAYSATSAGNGGFISVVAGDGGTSSSAANAAGTGGILVLNAGDGGVHSDVGGTSGTGGRIDILGGTGGSNSGGGAAGAGGAINVIAGPGASTGGFGGAGGAVSIVGGEGGLASASGGDVLINPGFAGAGGSNGSVRILSQVGGSNDESLFVGNTSNYPPTFWRGSISQTYNPSFGGTSLSITHLPTQAAAGQGILLTMGAGASSPGMTISHSGTGAGLEVLQLGGNAPILQLYGSGSTLRTEVDAAGILTTRSTENAGAVSAAYAEGIVFEPTGGSISGPIGVYVSDDDPTNEFSAGAGSLALSDTGAAYLNTDGTITGWSALATSDVLWNWNGSDLSQFTNGGTPEVDSSGGALLSVAAGRFGQNVLRISGNGNEGFSQWAVNPSEFSSFPSRFVLEIYYDQMQDGVGGFAPSSYFGPSLFCQYNGPGDVLAWSAAQRGSTDLFVQVYTRNTTFGNSQSFPVGRTPGISAARGVDMEFRTVHQLGATFDMHLFVRRDSSGGTPEVYVDSDAGGLDFDSGNYNNEIPNTIGLACIIDSGGGAHSCDILTLRVLKHPADT